MAQSIFTIILPVVPGKHALLRSLLMQCDYKGPIPDTDPLGFSHIETLHYASLFLYNDAADGWSLVFENNVDGEASGFIEELVDHASTTSKDSELLKIFRYCRGFENGEIGHLATYLERHVVLPSTGYSGCVGRTRNQIVYESELHDFVSQTLSQFDHRVDTKEAAQKVNEALSAESKFSDIGDIPKDTPDAEALLSAQSLSNVPKKEAGSLESAIDFIGQVLRALKVAYKQSGIWEVLEALAATVVFIVLGIWNQLRKEPSAPVDEYRPDPAHVRAQRAMEDFVPTNHMISVVHLHTDYSRRWAKWAGFVLLNLLARYEHTKGSLGAIPTIHFAHWSVINDGRRLLFVSNFDGSWDSYLDDFVLKAASGLTLAWSHGKGFPTSQFMFLGGAANGPEFIDWARRSMVPSLVWYNAYPHLSIRNINRNSALRQLIVNDVHHENAGNWLELVQ